MSSRIELLFSAPFRSLFLFVGIGALILVAVWLAVLFGALPWAPTIPATFWHMHEMIYGLLGAAIGGFLLTAVPNWTATSPIKVSGIAFICLTWLLSRLSPWLFPMPWGHFSQLAFQCLFWLSLIACITFPIVAMRCHRHYVFPVLLTLLLLSNALAYWLIIIGQATTATHLLKTSILVICFMTGIIGGRVVPFFIQRQTNITVIAFKPLDIGILLISSLGIAGYFLSLYQVSHLPNPGWLMMLAGILHALRLILWFNKPVLAYSLLWSLLIAYFCLGSGLIWLGYAHLVQQPTSSALHFLAICSLSAMVVSIATRVSLGHTGRLIKAPPRFVLFFLAIVLAGVVRSLGAFFLPFSHTLLISAVLWCIGFLFFIVNFTPIFLSPRADGRT